MTARRRQAAEIAAWAAAGRSRPQRDRAGDIGACRGLGRSVRAPPHRRIRGRPRSRRERSRPPRQGSTNALSGYAWQHPRLSGIPGRGRLARGRLRNCWRFALRPCEAGVGGRALSARVEGVRTEGSCRRGRLRRGATAPSRHPARVACLPSPQCGGGRAKSHQFPVASRTMTGQRMTMNSTGKMQIIIGTASLAGRL